MSLKTLMNNGTAYNAWANETFVTWLQQKPDEALSATVPSSFPSIVATLDHIATVQNYWLSVVSGAEAPPARAGGQTLDPKSVMDELMQSSQDWVTYVEGLSDEQLEDNVSLQSEWFSAEESRYDFIQQSLNHSTYHRGQIVTIARSAGVTDPPMTDYSAYLISLQGAW